MDIIKKAKPGKKANSKNAQKAMRLFNLVLTSYFNAAVAIIVILVLAVAVIFFLLPKYQQVAAEKAKVQQAQNNQYADLLSYYNKLVHYKAAYAAIRQTDKDNLNTMLPDENQHELLFTQISALIKQQGLLLTSLSITPDNSSANTKSRSTAKTSAQSDNLPAGVGSIKVNMSLSGVSYSSLLSLLSALENNMRLIDVNSIQYSPDTGVASLDATTYYVKSET